MPGVLERSGLGFEDMKRTNPKLIWCSLTGFGPSGPMAHRKGYNLMAEAMGGLMGITGFKDGSPVRSGIAITDFLSGLNAYGAIMTALFARERSGRGQRVDVSLLASTVQCLTNFAVNYLNCDVTGERWGNEHPNIVPNSAFPTQDGYLVCGAWNDAQYRDMCEVLGGVLTDTYLDPRFATNTARVTNRVEVNRMLETVLSSQPTSYWLQTLEHAGIPYAPVHTIP